MAERVPGDVWQEHGASFSPTVHVPSTAGLNLKPVPDALTDLTPFGTPSRPSSGHDRHVRFQEEAGKTGADCTTPLSKEDETLLVAARDRLLDRLCS